jgi:transposase
MMVPLHENARTTPLIRAEIAASAESARVLAERYGISEGTVYKWKHRTRTTDRSLTTRRGRVHWAVAFRLPLK